MKPWLDKNVDRPGFVTYLISYASIDTGLHRWAPAADTLMHALSVAKESGQEISIVLVLRQLSVVNAKLENFPEAYRYLRNTSNAKILSPAMKQNPGWQILKRCMQRGQNAGAYRTIAKG